MPFVRAIPAALLLAACAPGGGLVQVNKQPGLDGAWGLPDPEHPVRLETTGSTATVRFGGRTFVFEELETFRGHVGLESVRLLGRRIEVHIDPESLTVRDGGTRHSWRLADQPRGKVLVYAGGRLTFR